LQEQTEGVQCSWVAKSRILPEQRQGALKEGLCRCTRHVYGILLIAPQASVMPNELVLMRKQVAWRVGVEEAMRNQTCPDGPVWRERTALGAPEVAPGPELT
jgi:hypothetical protein